MRGLERAKLDPAQVGRASIIKCVGRVRQLPKGKVLNDAAAHCIRSHLKFPSGASVVAIGALAAKHLGCPGPIGDWRGFAWER